MSRDEGSPHAHDIKSLWATIANNEARLLALVEASAQIVWVTDEDGKVIDRPPREIAHLTWSAFTGLSQESLSGSGWAAAIHPDDVPVVARLTMHSRRTGNPVYGEFRVRHHSGEWRWLICRGSAVRAPDGKIVGWIGTCTDITPAKKTEAALRESQQRLVAALEAGEISTWIWRLADNTFWWDEAGEKLWGLTPDPNRNHDLQALQALIHPDDRVLTRRAIEETLATGVATNVEFRTVRADGKLQWLSSRGRVQLDADGKPALVVGAFADITKLKVAEDSLRQTQKLQALGTLAGGIAHDFNNLLLTIAGNVQLAIDEVGPEHRVHISLQEIAKASTRATDLVRRILSFSARQPLAPATTPVMPAISEALTLLNSSVPSNVSIHTRCDDALLACTLGAAELQQVMVNLVTNAVHAIGDRGGAINIAVGAGAPLNQPGSATRYAQIVVRDTGDGMDTSTLARIFDPFFTTKPAGKGTGLGLAVVHGVVQGCGGAIDVTSEPGRGSTFTVWLPLSEQSATLSQVVAPASTGHGEHILYVDDDESINYLIERLLGQLGYRVTCCTDPLEARRLFVADPTGFDVVVTDLSMPAMSGFDLIRALKSIRPNVPTILTSGYVRDEDQALAASIGIDHVILKPNTVQELGRALDALCKQLRETRTP